MKLPIPEAVFDQHVIALGKTRSGKSSAMRLLVEHLLEEEKPVCIVDPKGDWWGIKASADGKSAGYPLVIFGGEHGDVPLNARSGSTVAELVATGNRSSLIDLGGWMPGERTQFWIDFASTYFRSHKGRHWLVIDEVHNFCPKGKIMDPNAGKMLHWSNRLASEGLGKGIAMLAASQRPQKVHNDFLTSCETLIAMRVIHKADRDALKDWVDACGEPEKGKEVLNTVAQNKRGEAWVYSPESEFGPEKIQFPMFRTYDSFKPQKAGEATKLKGWAEVNLAEVTKKLEAVVKEAEANDPAKLKARIRELEKAKGAGKTVEVKVADQKAVRQAVDSVERSYRESERALLNRIKFLEQAINGIAVHFAKVTNHEPPKIKPFEVAKSAQARVPVLPTPKPVSSPVRKAVEVSANGNGDVTGPEQRILNAIAWMESIGIMEPMQTAVAFLADYTYGGGGFNNPRGALHTKGMVQYRGERIALTDAGRAIAKAPETPLTQEEMHSHVLGVLPGPEQKLLKELLAVYPEDLEKDELAKRVGYAPGSGGFNNPCGRLRTLGLVDYPSSGRVVAKEFLFPQ